jgi:dipeptidyl aminopeptidase/acylaminoacyl peptidase
MRNTVKNKKFIEPFALKLIIVFSLLNGCISNEQHNFGKLETKLFLGDGEKQPLVVAFGGSEGGNIYAQEETKELRKKILDNGFALLCIGYFGTSNTPTEIDRISLNAIYDTINKITNHPKIDRNRIGLIGSSRGGELVLNLGSHFQNFDAIVAMVAPNVNLPSRFGWKAHSSWSYNDKQIPFIIASKESIKKIKEGDFYEGMVAILEENKSNDIGKIEIEKISCPLLFISAKQDKVWPSKFMAEQMIKRLKEKNFKHCYTHIELDGGHSAPVEHIDLMIEFLKENLN